jgi:hypothetical protein
MPVDVPMIQAPGAPVIQPPAIYREAKQWRKVSEQILPAADVDRICVERSVTYRFARDPGKPFLGCSLMWPDRCEVVRIDRNDVKIHEMAHCAGWPPDHPDPVLPAGVSTVANPGGITPSPFPHER